MVISRPRLIEPNVAEQLFQFLERLGETEF
jgi:hypothetical protein